MKEQIIHQQNQVNNMDENFPVKVSKDGNVFCQGKECRVGQLIKKGMFDKCKNEYCPLAKVIRISALCTGVAITAQFNENMNEFRAEFKDLINEESDGATDISEQQEH